MMILSFDNKIYIEYMRREKYIQERWLNIMTSKNKIELKRVNMNLPSDLVQRVVDYGESKGLNTTSAYIVLLNQALDYKDTIDSLPLMMELIKSQVLSQQETKED